MAFPKVETAPTKLSFAEIAAMPAPSMLPALPATNQDTKPKIPSNANSTNHVDVDKGVRSKARTFEQHRPEKEMREDLDGALLAMSEMNILDKGVSQNRSLQHQTAAEPFEDANSNVSTSSLKQQSFDTKSIASVTTFAMDEKESIRPDDSASVRAAEDDDSNPGISRHSSFQHDAEPISSGQRGPIRPMIPNVSMAARRYPGIVLANPPRFGDLPVSPESDVRTQETEASEPSVSMPGGDHPRMPILTITPDEKLIEALASPKDRLPLLQLEERILTFLTYGRDGILDLPPQNSFTRLLTHKLADYYGLPHQVNEDSSSVRIFRGQPNALPVSLADVAKSIHVGPQHINAATQVKIMRRVQLGRQFSAGNSTAASSSVPSKATSENGGDLNSEEGLQSPYEGTPGREKPKSREEREAQYKAVRDRIFGDFQDPVTSENGSTGETSASMSRSSSTSGSKKKSRKSKTPKDDSFTRRSEFVAYGPMHMQQNFPPLYNDMNYQEPYHAQQSSAYSSQMYGQPLLQQYPQYDQNAVYTGPNVFNGNGNGNQTFATNEGWNNMQQTSGGPMYTMPALQNYSQQPQMSSHAKDPYAQNMPPVSPGHAWSQSPLSNFSQNPVTNGNGQWQNFNPNLGTQNPPYQFAQNSRQMYMSDASYPGPQAMLPALNAPRSLFNPQTRSFVPNNNTGRGGTRQNRKKGGQHENSMRTKDFSSLGNVSPATNGPSPAPGLREDSLQQKYGTPANLPKKPPPSQVFPRFAGDHSINTIPTSVDTSANGAQTTINGSKPAAVPR